MNHFCWPVVQPDSSSTDHSPAKGAASQKKSTVHKDKSHSNTSIAAEQEEAEEQPSFTTPHDSITDYIGVFVFVCVCVCVCVGVCLLENCLYLIVKIVCFYSASSERPSTQGPTEDR